MILIGFISFILIITQTVYAVALYSACHSPVGIIIVQGQNYGRGFGIMAMTIAIAINAYAGFFFYQHRMDRKTIAGVFMMVSAVNGFLITNIHLA